MHSFFTSPQNLKQTSLKRGILLILIGIALIAAWNAGRINIISALNSEFAAPPPRALLTVEPVNSKNKALRLTYSVSDQSLITTVALRVTPHDPSPGADNTTVEISIPANVSKKISRVDFKDLSALPWAGQLVTLQIIATNAAGKSILSNAVDLTLPERSFFHPIARALIEERNKLMQQPDDMLIRNEAANMMVGISLQTVNYHGDTVILMALRCGAVRLILEHGRNATISVNNLLWNTATRIEDGVSDAKQHMRPDVWQDLATKNQTPFQMSGFLEASFTD